MNDRNNRYGRSDDYGSRDFGSEYRYSSARDYAAAGELGGGRDRSDYGAGARRGEDRWNRDDTQGYGRQTRDWGERDDGSRDYREQGASHRGWAGGRDWDDRGGNESRTGRDSYNRAYGNQGYGGERYGRDDDRARGGQGGNRSDRGFFERAGDEVRSWFGDEEAERRRERDQRDEHYSSWRSQRIAELDRDYDEYRRENAQRFHTEFTGWRSERQGQRDSLSRVTEHMEVVGSDGSHVGTVDKVRGDRILLTKSDSEAGGHHHSIPSRWIQTVDDKVTLRKSADEAKSHWRDEERQGAMFREGDGEGRDDDSTWRTAGNLNRSFSGTY